MQDQPTPTEILTAVAAFLRDSVTPEASPHVVYQARVAANALELVIRQMDLAPAADVAETVRLSALLGRDGSLSDLNAGLAEALRTGVLDPASPEVIAHLWETTLAKLAVDQPRYSGYLAALDDDGVKPKDL